MQKELLQLSFLGIYRAATLPNNFRAANCYEVTHVKKCYKLPLQKSETKILDQKQIYKKLVESQREK